MVCIVFITYNIVFPRFNNPTGVFDNDQYVVAIAVQSTNTTDKTAMDTLWANIATKAGVTVYNSWCSSIIIVFIIKKGGIKFSPFFVLYIYVFLYIINRY